MGFTRHGVKRFIKKAANGLHKAMNIGEKIVNTVDKMSGGQLRSYAAQATGGKSEAALLAYRQAKNPIKRGLEFARGDPDRKVSDVVNALPNSGAMSRIKPMYHHGMQGLDRAKEYADESGLSRQVPSHMMQRYNNVRKVL